ncbi:hypothetical protein pb186bvf_008811 [Paramecium bursaria]
MTTVFINFLQKSQINISFDTCRFGISGLNYLKTICVQIITKRLKIYEQYMPNEVRNTEKRIRIELLRFNKKMISNDSFFVIIINSPLILPLVRIFYKIYNNKISRTFEDIIQIFLNLKHLKQIFM